jgi:opacity protein-like surface antigen
MQDLVAHAVRHTFVENEFSISTFLSPKADDSREGSYGIFAGYNWQFGEIVFGGELDFTRAKLISTGIDAIAREVATSNGFSNEVILSGRAESEVKNFGTLRARLGYTAGAWMPYVTAGAAIGEATVRRAVDLQVAGYHASQLAAWQTAYNAWLNGDGANPGVFGAYYGYSSFNPVTFARNMFEPQSFTENKKVTAVGVALGAGIDVSLTQNIFLRGEYQWVFFDDLGNQQYTVNTLRAAAGLKF